MITNFLCVPAQRTQTTVDVETLPNKRTKRPRVQFSARDFTRCFTRQTNDDNFFFFAYVTATNTFVRCDTSARPLCMPLLFGSASEHT